MNLPNKLTMLRMALIPVFVALALQDSLTCQRLAVLVYCIACITDTLDGYIARKHNLITNFGKFMDPIADKMLVTSAWVILVATGRMSCIACVIMLAREFLISGFRLVAAEKGVVIAAALTGKLKTVFQMISTILLLLFDFWLADIVLYIAVGLSVVSGVEYLMRNWENVIGDNI